MLTRLRSVGRSVGVLLVSAFLMCLAYAPSAALATGLGAKYSVELKGEERIGSGASIGNIAHRVESVINWGSGTTDGNINRIWRVDYAPAASGTTTYDLSSLTDADGTSIAIVELVCMGFKNTGTVEIELFGTASTASNFLTKDPSDIIRLRAGQSIFSCVDAGSAVSTFVSVKVLNTSGATAGAVSILLIGRSA